VDKDIKEEFKYQNIWLFIIMTLGWAILLQGCENEGKLDILIEHHGIEVEK